MQTPFPLKWQLREPHPITTDPPEAPPSFILFLPACVQVTQHGFCLFIT